MDAKIKLLRSSHSVGESNFHLQLTPKYRQDPFVYNDVLEYCNKIVIKVAEEMNVIVTGIGAGPDHYHIFLSNCKNYSAAELARRFKGRTSYEIRKKYAWRIRHKLWGKHFWSAGYFYRSVGAVSNEAMKRYVTESQRKHWQAETPRPAQTTLMQFN